MLEYIANKLSKDINYKKASIFFFIFCLFVCIMIYFTESISTKIIPVIITQLNVVYYLVKLFNKKNVN